MRRYLAALVVALSIVGLAVAPAAADGGRVDVAVKVGGQDVASANVGTPLRLVPGQWVDVELKVANHSGQAVHARRLDITGRVLGLVFFNYMALPDLSVAPGATETAKYRIQLIGLGDQATGLMRGDVTVIDDSGNQLARIPMVSDVRGSLFSVYGLFGLAWLVLTVLAAVDAALAIKRNRMSDNRILRGLRLLTPGIGVGFVLLFTATVLRIWVPRTPVWLVVSAGIAAAFFAIGYLTVRPVDHASDEPDGDEIDEDESADVDEATILVPVAVDTDAIDTATVAGADATSPVGGADAPTLQAENPKD